MVSCEYLLDMDIQQGTKVLPLDLVKKTINHFSFGSPHRIILLLLFSAGLRPSEPMELTWNNFIFEKGVLIFRPNKQNKQVVRRVKLPPKVQKELLYYRDNGWFPNGKILPYMKKSFCRYFNKVYRHRLPSEWKEYFEMPRRGSVTWYHKYQLRSFRTTHATLAYYYYARVYGHGDLAVKKTANLMSHSSSYTTSEYYIQRLNDLGIDNFPEMPFLQLIDHILYSEVQTQMDSFLIRTSTKKKKNMKQRQSQVIEHETGQKPAHYKMQCQSI